MPPKKGSTSGVRAALWRHFTAVFLQGTPRKARRWELQHLVGLWEEGRTQADSGL